MTNPADEYPKPDAEKVREIEAEFRTAYPHMDFSGIDGRPAGGWEPPLDMERYGRLLNEWVKRPELAELSLPEVKFALESVLSANSSNAARENTGPRASRYAGEYPAWLTAAKAAIATTTATTSDGRKRAVRKAIRAISPTVGKDALSTFLTERWPNIDVK